MPSSHRASRTTTALLMALICGGRLFLFAPESAAEPAVQWSPPALAQAVIPGESTTASATFAPSADAINVSVRVVPELARYLSVTPAAFASVTKGVPYTITLTFTAPADAALEVLHGAIQVREEKRNLARPLPVTLSVSQAYRDPTYGVAINIPFDFVQSNTTLDQPTLVSHTVLASRGGTPAIYLSIYENSSMLKIADWYEIYLANKEFTVADSRTRIMRQVNVASKAALEVQSNVMGITMIRTFVPHGTMVIGLSTWVPDFLPIPQSYFASVNSLKLF